MWKRIKRFFKDSETIFLARLQVLLGAIAALVTVIDPQLLVPVLPSTIAPWLIVVHGLALEYLRRRRSDDMAS